MRYDTTTVNREEPIKRANISVLLRMWGNAPIAMTEMASGGSEAVIKFFDPQCHPFGRTCGSHHSFGACRTGPARVAPIGRQPAQMGDGLRTHFVRQMMREVVVMQPPVWAVRLRAVLDMGDARVVGFDRDHTPRTLFEDVLEHRFNDSGMCHKKDPTRV